jgi:hypothetical protein
LTYEQAVDFFPACSPVADEMVFASLRSGAPDLYRMSLGTPGSEKMLLDTPLAKIPSDWSRDGRYLMLRATSLLMAAALRAASVLTAHGSGLSSASIRVIRAIRGSVQSVKSWLRAIRGWFISVAPPFGRST